ncbi:MAG TPA: pyruvate formate-lyase-activating protein [Caulobacteraceae bacterium]|jgi:pyruvate formate lyase activating enzyme
MTTVAPEKPPPLEAKSPFEMRIRLGEGMAETDVRSAVASGDLGFLHSFTTGSAVDGPGVRLVAWTTGCMFRCRFCHNPDTWTLTNGMPVSIDRATEEMRKYANGLKVMGGGFTLSGGEPLAQHRFAAKLFRAAKELEVHTALETNGFNGARLSDDEVRLIDLVILDLKGFTSTQHQKVCGQHDNEPVLDFAQRLAALRRPMWVRYVLVPGLTDLRDEMEGLADFAADLGVVERVEILPFHQMGRYKWENLKLDYTLEDVEPPKPASVSEAINVFRDRGLDAR